MARSFPRYLVVGVANTLLDLVIFSALAVGAKVPSLLSHGVSTVVVVTISFFINRHWVFGSTAGARSTALPFVAVTLFSAFVVQSTIITTALQVAPLLTHSSDAVLLPAAKILAMGTGMIVNYLGYRAVFARARP